MFGTGGNIWIVTKWRPVKHDWNTKPKIAQKKQTNKTILTNRRRTGPPSPVNKDRRLQGMWWRGIWHRWKVAVLCQRRNLDSKTGRSRREWSWEPECLSLRRRGSRLDQRDDLADPSIHIEIDCQLHCFISTNKEHVYIADWTENINN